MTRTGEDSLDMSIGDRPGTVSAESQAYRISGLRTDQECDELVELIRTVFGADDTLLWQSFHGTEPFYDRQWSRVVKHQGRIVSHVCWVPRQMRVGGVTVQAGMVGYVATHPDHRGKGLAARLMHTWTEELSRMGYHLSIVTGIPNFYERVGYSFAFPNDARDPAVALNLNSSRQSRPLPNHSRFEMPDLPVLEQLYQTENVGRTGTLVRDHEYWRGLVEGLRLSNRLSPEDIWLVKDRQERATGYMFLRRLPQGSYGILEASATGDAAADDLLELATTQALSGGASRLELKLPLDHNVTRRALQQGAELTGYSYGIHARILNLAGLFSALRPELETRLRASGWSSWQGTLRIKTDVGDLDIGIRDGDVRIDDRLGRILTAHVPQAFLVKLVTGYSNVAGITGLSRADMEPAAGQLLCALFPKGCPYLWNVDIGY